MPKRRRITKARVLTENEYYDMLKEKEREEKEREEQKQKRKEEREKRKKEKEEEKKRKEQERRKKQEDKKEAEEKKKKKEMEANKKKRRQKKGGPTTVVSDSDVDPTEPCPSTTSRKRQLPAQFQMDTSDSDDSDGSSILCALCNAREPEGLKRSRVFWVDCDRCGTWFHTFCTKTASSKYVCDSCN